MRMEFGADEPPLELILERLFGVFKTSIRLDPSSRTFRAEWVSAFSDKSPLEVSFDDISNVEAKSQTVEGYTNNWIRLELKSGERENIPGGSARKTRDAVDKIKAYIGWTPADVTAAPRAKEVRRNEMLLALGAIVFVVLLESYSSIKNYFFLPDCDDDGIKKTVEKIVEKATQPPVYLRDIQFVASEKRLTKCQATRAYDDGREEEMPYTISWNQKNDVVVEVFRKSRD